MSNDNQRRSFRISVVEEQRRARLRVHRQDYRVILEDESAGGFAVLTDGQIALHPGQEVHLKTASGWSVVRVAHSTSLGAHTRIGFERLEDLPDPAAIRDTQAAWWTYLLPCGNRAQVSWSVPCVAVCLFAIALAWMGYRMTSRGAQQSPLAINEAGANFFHSFSQDFQKRWKAAQESGAKIQLNPDQQSKIGAILFQAEQDVLHMRAKGRRNMQAESERMRSAEEDILSVLDSKQRSSWDQLADSPTPSL